MNLPLILKAFGVKVPPETLAKIEVLIPQIPDRISQAITVINDTIKQADARMAAIEEQQAAIRQLYPGLEERLNAVLKQQTEIIRILGALGVRSALEGMRENGR